MGDFQNIYINQRKMKNEFNEMKEYRLINFEFVDDLRFDEDTLIFLQDVGSKTWFAHNEEEMITKCYIKNSSIKPKFEVVEKRYKITHIEFNHIDTTTEEIIELDDFYLAHTENELRCNITEETGLCIKNIKYEVCLLGQHLNTLRPGTVVQI